MAKKQAVVKKQAEMRSVSLSTLQPDQHNANKGTQRGRAMLESSVRRYGLGRSLVTDKHGRIIAGNKTFEAAGVAGIKDAIVIPTDGSKLIVHQRTDLDLEKDAEAKELAIVDNQANAVGLAFHGQTLAELEAQGVDMQQFFRPNEWAKLVEQAKDASSVGGEEIPEMEIQPFEHHDYIMVVFTDSHAWSSACDRLGIRRSAVTVGGRKKIGTGRVIRGERLLEILEGKKAKKK